MIEGKTVWHDATFGEILNYNNAIKLKIINILIKKLIEDTAEEAIDVTETNFYLEGEE